MACNIEDSYSGLAKNYNHLHMYVPLLYSLK